MITGLPVFASLRYLYYETGWETLAERRTLRKLTFMYKIVNGDAPSNLMDLLLIRIDNVVAYNPRYRIDFEIPFTRLCSYEYSNIHLIKSYGMNLTHEFEQFQHICNLDLI